MKHASGYAAVTEIRTRLTNVSASIWPATCKAKSEPHTLETEYVLSAIELEQILVLILDDVRSIVDRLGAVCFCRSALVQQYQ